MQQINQSFGCGGMSCAFDNNILTVSTGSKAIIRKPPDKQTVMVTGRQSNNTWVFSEHVQISDKGSLISEDDDYVWIPRELLGENAATTSSECHSLHFPSTKYGTPRKDGQAPSNVPEAELRTCSPSHRRHSYVLPLLLHGQYLGMFTYRGNWTSRNREVNSNTCWFESVWM